MDIPSVGGTIQSSLPNTVQNTTTFDQLQTSTTNTTNTAGVRKHHGHHAPPTVSSMLSQLSSKLGLNDNQMADLKTILNKAFASLNNNKQSGAQTQGTNGGPNPTSNKAIFDAMNNQIKAILNPSQLQIFNNMQTQSSKQTQQSPRGDVDNDGDSA